jgi:hypothetical protein
MLSDALSSLDDALKSHFLLFETVQKVHFDWLQSVAFQLQMYEDFGGCNPPVSQKAIPTERSSSKQLSQLSESTRPARSLPSSSKRFDVSRVRFGKETSDLDKSAGTTTIRGWKTHSFNVQFPLVLKELPLPTKYEMSDDGDLFMSPGIRDEEVYQTNPFEIHGKIIPLWARREVLDRHLSRQLTMDGDVIFRDLAKTCELNVIFGN